MGRDVVGLTEEARRVGVNPRRARRLVDRGLVEAVLAGGVLLVRPGALDAWARPAAGGRAGRLAPAREDN